MIAGLTLFLSYAHEDDSFRKDLEKHLASLRREGLVEEWHDRMIEAGQEWDKVIHANLDQSNIILLLISPDFMDSSYCNEVETKRAMQRHEMGVARVIPVLLRPADWEGAPFSKLQAVPTGARPINEWPDRDAAFVDVVGHLRNVCRELAAINGNPANPYVVAQVGDWYQSEVILDIQSSGETRVGSMRMTLVEKDAQRAVVRAEVEFPDAGVHEDKTIEVPLDRPTEDSMGQIVSAITSEQIPADAMIETHQTGAGAEKLFIGGRTYYTTWIASECEIRVGRERFVQKGTRWMSSEIPLDGIVKLVMETPGAMTQTMIVTAYGRAGQGLRTAPPKPPERPITLQGVIAGQWNVEIGQPFGPPMGATIRFDPQGLFFAQAMSPMYGVVSIQGQWQAQGPVLALQGVQTVAFTNMPYAAQITFSAISPGRLIGTSNLGEQVSFTRM